MNDTIHAINSFQDNLLVPNVPPQCGEVSEFSRSLPYFLALLCFDIKTSDSVVSFKQCNQCALANVPKGTGQEDLHEDL